MPLCSCRLRAPNRADPLHLRSDLVSRSQPLELIIALCIVIPLLFGCLVHTACCLRRKARSNKEGDDAPTASATDESPGSTRSGAQCCVDGDTADVIALPAAVLDAGLMDVQIVIANEGDDESNSDASEKSEMIGRHPEEIPVVEAELEFAHRDAKGDDEEAAAGTTAATANEGRRPTLTRGIPHVFVYDKDKDGEQEQTEARAEARAASRGPGAQSSDAGRDAARGRLQSKGCKR